MGSRELMLESAMGEGKASGSASASDSDSSEGPEGIRRVSSAALLEGDKELVIDHGGVRYRLRCTSNGKLILTK